MKLIVLSSGSKGNGYLLTNGECTLVIEAGVHISEVKKMLDFDLSSIRGVIVSHEHSDHFGWVHEYLKSGIDVFCSPGTALYCKERWHHRLFEIMTDTIYQIGEFKVKAFDVEHDAEQPYGFLINHPDSGNILFLTDSYFSEYKFHNLNQVILEINYSNDILDNNINTGKLNPMVRNRIITSHMGIETGIELLKANDLSLVNNIVLIHLSDGNSHAENFRKEIEAVTGKTVTVADKGVEINIDKIPF